MMLARTSVNRAVNRWFAVAGSGQARRHAYVDHQGAAAGAVAGAAGTTALNAVTYADMSIRGRPSSDAPAQAVERAAGRAGVAIRGDDETRGNRLSGLGALSGIGTGVAVGAACGIARALGRRMPVGAGALIAATAAMAGSDGPMFALGVSDPHEWSAADWTVGGG
jgi:hypothetical protein